MFKAIYGLKQSPREWNLELHLHLVKIGYKSIQSDPCIYIRVVSGFQLPIILILYVDDTLAIYHPDMESIWESDKKKISDKYKITDMGPANWILKMKLVRDQDGGRITLDQTAYIDHMLQEFGMIDCNIYATPSTLIDFTDPNHQRGEPLNAEQHAIYRSMVGALLYAANVTRVDISYIVGLLARYVSYPTEQHMVAAKHVLRYLKGTKDLKLHFIRP